jgi:hypothetical protein
VVLQLVSEERAGDVELLTSDNGDLLTVEDLLERAESSIEYSEMVERECRKMRGSLCQLCANSTFDIARKSSIKSS